MSNHNSDIQNIYFYGLDPAQAEFELSINDTFACNCYRFRNNKSMLVSRLATPLIRLDFSERDEIQFTSNELAIIPTGLTLASDQHLPTGSLMQNITADEYNMLVENVPSILQFHRDGKLVLVYHQGEADETVVEDNYFAGAVSFKAPMPN